MAAERTIVGSKDIVAERYASSLTDVFNEPSDIIYFAVASNLKVGKKNKQRVAYYGETSYSKNTATTVWLEKAAFADGTVWQDNGDHVCAAQLNNGVR